MVYPRKWGGNRNKKYCSAWCRNKYSSTTETANGMSKIRGRLYRDKRRKKLLDAYGGRCACCGEFRQEFLTLEHIGGGGRKHYLKRGAGVYIDVKRTGYPKDRFELLCMNCNFAGSRGRVCPHMSEVAIMVLSA